MDFTLEIVLRNTWKTVLAESLSLLPLASCVLSRSTSFLHDMKNKKGYVDLEKKSIFVTLQTGCFLYI